MLDPFLFLFFAGISVIRAVLPQHNVYVLGLDKWGKWIKNQHQIFHAKKKKNLWSSHCGAAETNLTMKHEIAGLVPGLYQWIKDLALP